MSHSGVSLWVSRSVYINSSSFTTATTSISDGFWLFFDCVPRVTDFFLYLTEFEKAYYSLVHSVGGCCIVLKGESFSVT